MAAGRHRPLRAHSTAHRVAEPLRPISAASGQTHRRQGGWAEPCEELGLPGHPPFGPDSANLNLVLSQTPSDPISGSSPLRAQVCEVSRLNEHAEAAAAPAS